MMATRTEEIYIPCECRVSIFFPAGHIECDICPLLQTYSRRQCMRTGELIPAWQKRGYCCADLFGVQAAAEHNAGSVLCAGYAADGDRR